MIQWANSEKEKDMRDFIRVIFPIIMTTTIFIILIIGILLVISMLVT